MTRFLIEIPLPAETTDLSEARKLARQQALERIPLHIVEEQLFQEPKPGHLAEDAPNPNPKIFKTWWDFHQ